MLDKDCNYFELSPSVQKNVCERYFYLSSKVYLRCRFIVIFAIRVNFVFIALFLSLPLFLFFVLLNLQALLSSFHKKFTWNSWWAHQQQFKIGAWPRAERMCRYYYPRFLRSPHWWPCNVWVESAAKNGYFRSFCQELWTR